MDAIYQFLIVVLTAIVLQNAVFTRGLGSSKGTLMMSSPKKILFFGGTLTFIAVFSSLLAWPFVYLLRQNDAFIGQPHWRYLIALGSICVVYALLYFVSRRFLPVLHYHIQNFIEAAAFNSAVLGAMLIAFGAVYSFSKTAAFALGAGIGYTLALLLIYEGKRRIMLSEVPRSFRGFPVMLLYMGILSLAIYGLIGHQLPT
ncbi:Rnf-Nqr domain containing protein [Anaerotruncus rubiinfantis]|uniref:Rnf-Nqr domain containing protein n=3 Tax=Anaerotruncus rubiinfantis TaxID=1720200 RepID=UPI00189B6DA2|nr:Rnf-Nqr domain containing protein [Anaerotruncus rubiinfantis]